MESRIAEAYRHAVQYVLGRQCASGGFCFYRSELLEEPNLADTYHAVSTLKLLGEPLPREAEVVAFLDRFPASDQPAHLFYLTCARRAIEPAFRPADQTLRAIRRWALMPPASRARLSGWLDRARMIAPLKRDFGEPVDIDTVGRWLEGIIEDGGFGSRPNLTDTWRALEILDACGDPMAVPAIATFVDRLQCEPFGFSDTLISAASNVDVVFAGVRSCKLLGLAIRFPSDAIGFLLQCQTSNGGFARAPDALPTIEYTYEAVAALQALNDSPPKPIPTDSPSPNGARYP